VIAAFLRAELGPRPGRLRASLRIVAACLIGTVLILAFEMPHGGWAIFSIFTVSQADAGASLRRGLERLLGTAVGGGAALLSVLAFVDLPFVFVPLLGIAVAAGVYGSRVFAAPYPPLLFALTYLLVALSHVDSPEDYVGVALWRMTAIGLGVALATGAQLFLWPDDPLDKLRHELVRRLDLVRALADQAISGAPGSRTTPPESTLALGDITGQLQLLANAEVRYPALRSRNAEHTALILEVARLFSAAVWASETVPTTAARGGFDPSVGARLGAIRDDSARLARALESRRWLLATAEPVATITPEGSASGPVAATAPVVDGMERALDRIVVLTGIGSPRDGVLADSRPPVASPLDVSEPAGARAWPLDPPALKVGLKAALGVEICYVIMQALAWPGLLTSTVTCVIVGGSTVGANLSKAVLRQVGALFGGFLGLVVIVAFMPNLHGLTSYLIAVGVALWIAAWIAVGGPRTAYAGIQTALALGIMLLGDFGPTTDLVSGRDRVLGILLGAAVMGVIDQTLWPIQARRAMRPTVARALRMMAELGRAGREPGTGAAHPRGLRARIYRTLASALQLREESRMEGDPDTPATRSESDLILHLVTDAQAAMPGLLAAAGERLAASAPAPRTPLAEHVEEFERVTADFFEAAADAVEGKPAPGFAALRARAHRLAEATGDAPCAVPIPSADESAARLATRHLTSHQLLRLVTRLDPGV